MPANAERPAATQKRGAPGVGGGGYQRLLSDRLFVVEVR